MPFAALSAVIIGTKRRTLQAIRSTACGDYAPQSPHGEADGSAQKEKKTSSGSLQQAVAQFTSHCKSGGYLPEGIYPCNLKSSRF
jgi:hypothetical protein